MWLLVLRNGFLIDRVAVVHKRGRVGIESSGAFSTRVPTATGGKYADGGLNGEMWRGLYFQRRSRVMLQMYRAYGQDHSGAYYDGNKEHLAPFPLYSSEKRLGRGQARSPSRHLSTPHRARCLTAAGKPPPAALKRLQML